MGGNISNRCSGCNLVRFKQDSWYDEKADSEEAPKKTTAKKTTTRKKKTEDAE